MHKYYALIESAETAELYIYGDITSRPWLENDVSAYNIVQELEAVTAPNINVRINSYGGEVAEGLAIFNALKRHSAQITTYCDGFACSAAAVVFMAGDERIMGEASLLMIHNAWTYAAGNAAELRKEADDLDTISDAAANAFRAAVNISDEKLSALLDAETWLAPQDAVEIGFATAITTAISAQSASMSTRKAIFERLNPVPTLTLDADAIARAIIGAMKPAEQATSTSRPPENNPEPISDRKFFKFGGKK